MKILVVGGGGREHALVEAISRSSLCDKLYCAPGNAGIGKIAELVAIAAEDVDALTTFAKENAIDLVVVGPEGPLVAGLVDRLEAIGIKAFGPSAKAAQLEGSKGFMKDMVSKVGVPTAAYGRFTDIKKAKQFVRENGAPIVVKTDGLAAGKGVVVAMSEAEAISAIDAAMGDKAFGAAGDELVIEQFLQGEEASFFALIDGDTAISFGAAQDHKRVGDGDTGPNTGGMGAYSPAPVVTEEVERKIMQRCVLPLVKGMKEAGMPYRGVLFAGLMIDRGEPTLIEYNVRFGDPECQVLMARLDCDIVPLLLACAEGKLAGHAAKWKQDPAMVVVMAAAGYPGSYKKGGVIGGLDAAGQVEGVKVLHAGTKTDAAGQVVAAGGRVLGVTAHGADLRQARERAYQAVDKIEWADGFCRRDIGWRALS
jgi:phosphoribosylamine--glycine ligase